jgi:hypothetical protein
MKIGISTFGVAGDILPMLEYGRRVEEMGHDVEYLIFALDDKEYGKNTVRLNFNGNRFAMQNIDWMSPTALTALYHESISANMGLIAKHCFDLNSRCTDIVNFYFLQPMRNICTGNYTSFSLNPSMAGCKIPEVVALNAVGKSDIIAVDPIFGGTGYYYSENKAPSVEVPKDAVFMGLGSQQKFVKDRALALFDMIEKNISKPCFIQGRDFDFIDYDSAFEKCSVILHHGGVGTTHQATRSGTKQIVFPLQADNLFWAMKVEELGLGINAHTLGVDKIIEEIEVVSWV